MSSLVFPTDTWKLTADNYPFFLALGPNGSG